MTIMMMMMTDVVMDSAQRTALYIRCQTRIKSNNSQVQVKSKSLIAVCTSSKKINTM